MRRIIMSKFTIPAFIALLCIPVAISLYGACCGEEVFRSHPFGRSGSWERGDGRCNLDSDCGPGRECSAFGMCQLCN